MHTTPTPSTPGTGRTSGTTQGMDAIALLTQDHEKVKSLFGQYEALGERAAVSKQKLAMQICTELTKHATAEEEIFYPAVRAASRDNEDIIDEAFVEHASARELIAQLLDMEVGDELYDAKIKVLGDQIRHHIEEEEGDMFPRARDADLDLGALGEQIAQRKTEVDVPPH